MKVLFVSHDASRTGAPLMLLYFLKWLKISHPEVSFDLLVLGDGVLKSDFKKLTLNYFEKKESRYSVFRRIINKLVNKSNVMDVISKFRYDIIYSNSVVSLNTSIHLKNRCIGNPRIICHVHELALIVKLLVENFKDINISVDYFIAASDKVRKMLNHDFGVRSSKISTIYEFSGLNLGSLNFNPRCCDEFIVGGSGTGHWRKGTDIFVLVANWVSKNFPEKRIKFKWVGSIQYPDSLILENDVEKLGISSKIEFVGEVEEPRKEYQSFDIFLLTSREDPFPLAAIEIAQIGVPIICFSGATGTEEVLMHGGGKCVPYLDVEEMGKQIIYYYDDQDAKFQDGQSAKNLFSRFTPDLICPEIYSVIRSVVSV
ncbi:glycosyltransferase [Algoriphagus lacus]|uniref:Glycosyltransferase n=1 Tax=Algoriphagus lacus TaxID=2056311 RepID=A0A418PMW2_9BACT|nr:glycosyltransferase family 4 protein [Algoriphagus lacus]RIW13081.1 glycosyltransferase [Algoriphagus lacus]